MSLLRVFAFKATHLPNVDKKGCSDPYTTLAYQAQSWAGLQLNNDMSRLRFLKISATKLPNVEKFGKSDPYACVQFQACYVVSVNELKKLR
ncbi:hypothetical protein P5673_002834 [Acropora cervicornis]|uniref:C2 domain-containing protein n=1 Tax=Acropora cervicornis TaxID=6130 RepID=A0AAD9R3P2_ACRCE|nr:hypothetical protein P5673_002834 [Acropora cervicornis]